MDKQRYNDFLKKLYDILDDKEVINYDKKPSTSKEKVERIESYLDKLQRVQDKVVDSDRHLDTIKELYYDKYIIKKENIPDSYFRMLEQKYLNEGHGHHNLVNQENETDKRLKEEHINTIIKEQKDSLDSWLSYFLSKDSDYLDIWAKVWAFQGMLEIGTLNKDKTGYNKRTSETVAPFINIDSEILNKCVEYLKESLSGKKVEDIQIRELIYSSTFPKLYEKLLLKKKSIKLNGSEGIWIKYSHETLKEIEEKEKNNIEPEYLKLYRSLQGYNTGWCTAGSKETAKAQICGFDGYAGGDFYVYYSKDEDNNYTIPRIAIRMDEDSIGEIRGIAKNQNIEANMELILEDKLKEFPDAEKYKKKVHDMKLLTQIYNKYKVSELSQEELRFLYELDNKIEGFGWGKDPRIKEIKESRNKIKDYAKIFNCKEEEIGFSIEDLNREIVCFVGKLDLEKIIDENLKLPENMHGNLYLRKLESLEGLKLPNTINGNVYLYSLISAKGLKLPNTINGNLNLKSLTSAEGLILPDTVNGSLDLCSLESVEGLKLPNTINGSLDLSSLKLAKSLKLPDTINGNLNLNSLKSLEGLRLPDTLNGDLDLNSLKSAAGLKLPDTISGSLNLSSLKLLEGLRLPDTLGGLNLDSLETAAGLKLPDTINGDLTLRSLGSVEDLKLPDTINGNLNLRSLKSAEGLKLPDTINGNLNLNSLKSAAGLKLPDTFNGDLSLSSLTSAEGLVLPDTINGSLDLGSLKSAKGLKLPSTLNRYLNLYSLESAEGLKLPDTLNGDLDLSSLKSAEGLVLPDTLNGSLYLNSLESAKGLRLPDTFNGSLYLNSLTSAKGLRLPDTLNGSLNLNSLKSAEGLVLPDTLNGSLFLDSLESAEGLVFPENLKVLNLDSLKTAKNVVFPKNVDCGLNLDSLEVAENITFPEYIKGDLYLRSLKTAKELILPQKINGSFYSNLMNNDEQQIKKHSLKTPSGFISITFTIIIIIFIAILFAILVINK